MAAMLAADGIIAPRQRTSCSINQVLDVRECCNMEASYVLGQKNLRASVTYGHLLRWPKQKCLRKEIFWSALTVQSQGRQIIARSFQRHLKSSTQIYCSDEGGDYFSSGEAYSDGEGSSGGTRGGYSSGSESESDKRDVNIDFFEEDKSEPRKIDVAAPLYKNPYFQKHGFPPSVGQGAVVTTLLFFVLAGTLVVVDSYIWRVIRRPLAHYFLTIPFCIAAAASAYMGYICVPLLERIKAHQVFRIEGPTAHQTKVGTPTMGGLFLVPAGIGVARFSTGFWSNELRGVCVATLAFAAIGLLDDSLAHWRKHNYGLSGTLKFVLQVAVGVCFVFWLDTANLQSPYKMCGCLLSTGVLHPVSLLSMRSTVVLNLVYILLAQPIRKKLIPLPPPLGIWNLGKWYLPLTAFCFAAMSNGVNLTDGLDGLAAGTSAAAYIGMAVAVLPIYPGLGIFGAAMAGACLGFLVHNKYKAKVFMGDTGSLALGGGLAAMAACTGMYLPLFIASGVFIIETISVILQVSYFKLTKRFEGQGRRLLRMAPFHHHLELIGMKEPVIIAAAYVVSYVLAICAAHVGLISA